MNTLTRDTRLLLNHGHFEATFGEFREEPPDPNLKPEYSERFRLEGYNRIQQECGHAFYKEWIAPDFPRFVVMKVQHANPFYDDSYAVNSANLGPYGDAIMTELLPEVERQFRCLGQGWSRFTYGGSTGGWEALAVQMFYPDAFNGCFAACPDPVDFRAYGAVNIYEDKNAYYSEGPWSRIPRPATRDRFGCMTASVEQVNRLELVLGTHSRSGSQWDIWEAVFGPVGPDGYPARIWDKRTGVIDPAVAAYWRITSTFGLSSSEIGPSSRRSLPARSTSTAAPWTTTSSTTRSCTWKSSCAIESAVWRCGRLRVRVRALLERRSHATQRHQSPALPPDVRGSDPQADCGHRPRRRRPHQLAV
jgi:hypothetical protein